MPWSLYRRVGIIVPLFGSEDAENLLVFSGTAEAISKVGPSIVEGVVFEIDCVYFSGSSVTIMQIVDDSILQREGIRQILMQTKVVSDALDQMRRDQIILEKIMKLHGCRGATVIIVIFFFGSEKPRLHSTN